jgi:hypothetical protein
MKYLDDDEAERLKAEPWMLELLNCNPEYCGWGPHEDYMWKLSEGGWDSRVIVDNWKIFHKGTGKDEHGWDDGGWTLNDLNELVNFYFSIERDQKNCPTCGGCGVHPDAQWVTESWYQHQSPFSETNHEEQMSRLVLAQFTGGDPNNDHNVMVRCSFPSEEVLARYGDEFRTFCEEMNDDHYWSDKIGVEEVQALIDEDRVKNPGFPLELVRDYLNAVTKYRRDDPELAAAKRTLEEYAQENGIEKWDLANPFGHDAINRWVCTKARAKRMGIPTACPECDEHGSVFTADAPQVLLTLWWLHPRKGCSRGIEIKDITQEDLPEVRKFLEEARQRNHDRFAGLEHLPEEVPIKA